MFVFEQNGAGLGYYGEGGDPLRSLTSSEEKDVRALALTAAARIGAPDVAVDIGQCVDGRWIVIETGEAQFSGISRISPFELWNNLRRLAESGEKQEDYGL